MPFRNDLRTPSEKGPARASTMERLSRSPPDRILSEASRRRTEALEEPSAEAIDDPAATAASHRVAPTATDPCPLQSAQARVQAGSREIPTVRTSALASPARREASGKTAKRGSTEPPVRKAAAEPATRPVRRRVE